VKRETTNKGAQGAEFEEGADISMDVDYDVQEAFDVKSADRNYYYFLAANDGDRDRPDGVHQCKLKGYEVCKDETTAGGGDCTLMRIPRKVFEARRARTRKRRIAAREAQRAPRGVPSNNLVHISEAGERPGADDAD
jgi:hypothetical protein